MLRKALILVSALPALAGASVVYDNMSWTQGWYWAENPGFTSPTAEGGDQVTLGGTDRAVTNIDILFYSLWDAGTADVTVNFYKNDGVGGAPGTLLWTSGTMAGMSHVQGLQTYSFAVPSVVVPNTFTWTLGLANRTGSTGDIGPALADPPTVGSSGDFFWYMGSGGWATTGWGGSPVANFGARITAAPVPEPAAFGVLGVGVVALLRRRGRK
ncbi:MAG TPA: PEP-CTERM sorting domain-containing protein [Fimbriimonadaceae bacterium]|nr:PEP-CTERM sorting domain-containing protein [Fimbriimonadaceae bacterium]